MFSSSTTVRLSLVGADIQIPLKDDLLLQNWLQNNVDVLQLTHTNKSQQ